MIKCRLQHQIESMELKRYVSQVRKFLFIEILPQFEWCEYFAFGYNLLNIVTIYSFVCKKLGQKRSLS